AIRGATLARRYCSHLQPERFANEMRRGVKRMGRLAKRASAQARGKYEMATFDIREGVTIKKVTSPDGLLIRALFAGFLNNHTGRMAMRSWITGVLIAGLVAVSGDALAQTVWTVPEVGVLPRDGHGAQVRLGRDLVTATYNLIGPNVGEPAKRYAGNN